MNTINLKRNKRKIKSDKSGFVILFAMVVSLIIILITSGMYTITHKQAIISSYTRESQKAFYAANSALECALFHDISPYINETAFPYGADDSYTKDISCGGNDFSVKKIPVQSSASGYEDLFSFRYPEINDSTFGITQPEESGCAYVLVEKKEGEEVNGVVEVHTRVTAVGFNTCIKGSDGLVNIPNFDDPTLLERRLSSTYTTYKAI